MQNCLLWFFTALLRARVWLVLYSVRMCNLKPLSHIASILLSLLILDNSLFVLNNKALAVQRPGVLRPYSRRNSSMQRMTSIATPRILASMNLVGSSCKSSSSSSSAPTGILRELDTFIADIREELLRVLMMILRMLPKSVHERLCSPLPISAQHGLTGSASHFERHFIDQLNDARRKSELYMSVNESDSTWIPIADKDGVKVWKKWLPSDCYGSEFPCVKATGIVRAPPEDILALLFDSKCTQEYNVYSIGRVDIEKLDESTKVVWNRTKPPLSKKIHDFCSLMQMSWDEEGKKGILLTTATSHPLVPKSKDSVRSKIQVGLTVVKPHHTSDDDNCCCSQVTTLSHIIINGAPNWVVNKVVSQNALEFLKCVDRAASKNALYTQQEQGGVVEMGEVK